MAVHYKLIAKAGTICGITSNEAMARFILACNEELTDLVFDIIDMETDNTSEVSRMINGTNYIAEAHDWDENRGAANSICVLPHGNENVIWS